MLSRRRFVSSALGTAAARRLVRAQGCSASTSNSISEPTMAQIQSIVEAHLPTVSPYIGAAIGLASPAFGAHIVCIGSLVNQLGNPMAFTTDTPFEIASVTKTATASVYQRLIQNGRINHKETLGRSISREVSDKIRAIPLFDLANYTRYQYNADGLMTGFTDALGNKWAYDYDGAARPSAKTDPTGVTLKATYTTDNRIASLTAGDTTTAFDYSGIHRDSLNRLLYYDDSNGARLVYLYDKDGQLRSITGWGQSDHPFYEVVYEYDHLHRLSKVYLGGSFALYSYDAAGRPISVSVSGGPVTIYQYDRAHNLRAIVSTGPDGTPVAGYRYTVDPNGNRTAVSRS